jgi:hypothetical protein
MHSWLHSTVTIMSFLLERGNERGPERLPRFMKHVKTAQCEKAHKNVSVLVWFSS